MIRPQAGVQVGHEEIGVFEIAEKRQVGRHAEGKHGAPAGAACQRHPHQVVEGDRGEQQRHIDWVPPAIEEQRGDHQPGRGQPPTQPRDQEEGDDGDREVAHI